MPGSGTLSCNETGAVSCQRIKKLNAVEKILFENPEKAKHVLEVFLRINGQMNETIEIVEKEISPEEYNAFKKGVGHVMYEVFDKIIEPICKRHPSLRPPEMES